MSTFQEEDGHIIMFPFMAQGHLTQFIALAKFISQRKPNTKITIVNTPLNVRRLQSTLLTSETKICLAELPFSSTDHGLPPNSENCDSLPSPRLIRKLLYASETLKPSFDNLITETVRTEKRVPSCIIFDPFLGWVTDTAKRVGTSSFAFAPGGYGMAMMISMWLYSPHRKNDHLIEEFHVPKFPDTCRLQSCQLGSHLRDSNEELTAYAEFYRRHISFIIQKSDGMLCNSVEEIEVVGLEALRNHMGSKPVWAVGPLLPSFLLQGNQQQNARSVVSHSRTGKEFGISPESCIEWLNHQKPGSVLYISFGSQNTISTSNMIELALGLEKSGKSFIWVLRPPIGFESKSEFKWSEWLPEGFVERMNETQKGFLVEKWAPQLEILCHGSTGAFLSHCGWNSVLESLSRGVPIIGWPLYAEQPYNSKMIQEEMGISVELARGFESKVSSDDVKRVIEQVMDSSKGQEMRNNAIVIAKKISAAMIEDEAGGHQKGSSIESLDDFLATVSI